ncbi:MAG: hypothetical protein WDZ65_05145 [Aquisalimonadaceae bacterium]
MVLIRPATDSDLATLARLFTASVHGVHRLSTEASLKVRPFFEAQGFRVVEEQSVERGGVH